MPLIKRLVKGSPLTFQEGDDNLDYLENLALNPFPFTGSAVITGSLTITGSLNILSGSNLFDNTVVKISVPDISGAISPNSYTHTPTFIPLRFGTTDIAINPASYTYNPMISLGRHYGAGIMLYHNVNDFNSVYGIGITSFAMQSYIPGGYGAQFTWNQYGYNPITGTNELMRLTNSGNLSIFATSSLGHRLYVNGTSLLGGNTTVSGSFNVSGSINVNGTITATTLIVQTITSSQSWITGSTKFGNDLSNTHQFTGSVSISGSLNATASWATNAISSSHPIAVTGSTIYSTAPAAGGSNFSGNSNIFLGLNAGFGATSTQQSNFLGSSAGFGATNTGYSNFLGRDAGYQATNASNSNFLGFRAGYGATNANTSNFLGDQAGYQATSATFSNFLGFSAGYQATSANNSNFLGFNAGYQATSATFSNFLGLRAGYSASSANNSNFLGPSAGDEATNAYQSNFLGPSAGNSATNAFNSNFLGSSAGLGATNARFSNFLGVNAGAGASNAGSSNFLGFSAGYQAISASYSTLIGWRVGTNYDYVVDDITYTDGIGPNNIIIGTNITLPVGQRNSINLGAIIFATGSYYVTESVSNPYSGSVMGKVGINQSNPQYELQVSGTINSNYIDAPSRYDLVTYRFSGGTGSIFNTPNPIQSVGYYNPNYAGVFSITTDYLSYVYVDISDSNNVSLYKELTFNTVNDLEVFVNDINLSGGYITLYSYKNNIGSLKLGGYNHLITNVTFRGTGGKISSKRSLTRKIDITSRGYTALKTYLTGSFITALSQSISLSLLNEIITEQQITTLVNTGSISFTRMDKYNKRELSGFYINIKNKTNPSGIPYVVNSTGDDFITGGSIGSQTKILSTSLIGYDQIENGVYTQKITTPFWIGGTRTVTGKVNGNSFANLYIVQDIVNNGRALYIEPISVDGIVVPFSSKKYVLSSTCQYFIKKGSFLQYIPSIGQVDPGLNVESLDIYNIFGFNQLNRIHNKKSKKQIDIIRLYDDRTCDVFEDGLRVEYSTYNGNLQGNGVKAVYFKLNKR